MHEAGPDPVRCPRDVRSAHRVDGEGLRLLGLRAAYPITAIEPDVGRAIGDAAGLLRRAARTLAAQWLGDPGA